MSVKIEINYRMYDIEECPFCGKADNIVVTSKDVFADLRKENGSACISIECNNCSLDLYEHNYDGPNYDTKVAILIQKWNRRKKEENDGIQED